MRRVINAVDQALTHPWLSRVSNVWFVWGLIATGYGFLLSATDLFNPLSLLLLFGFVAVFVVSVGGAGRTAYLNRTRRRSQSRHPEVASEAPFDAEAKQAIAHKMSEDFRPSGRPRLPELKAPGPVVIATEHDAIRAKLDKWVRRGERLEQSFVSLPTREEIEAMSVEQKRLQLMFLGHIATEESGSIQNWHHGVVEELHTIGRGAVGLYTANEPLSRALFSQIHDNRMFLAGRLDELRTIRDRVDELRAEETRTATTDVTFEVPPRLESARTVVLHDRVELSVAAGNGFLPSPSVTCEVTTPSGTTYRTSVKPRPDATGPFAVVLAPLAPRRAVAEYPFDFSNAPYGLAAGTYVIRWTVPSPLGIGFAGPRIIRDSFLIAHARRDDSRALAPRR